MSGSDLLNLGTSALVGAPDTTVFFSLREFVVAIMSDWFVEAANHSCGSFPPEVDEMAAAGLTPVPSVRVAPPRVQESAISMECKVRAEQSWRCDTRETRR